MRILFLCLYFFIGSTLYGQGYFEYEISHKDKSLYELAKRFAVDVDILKTFNKKQGNQIIKGELLKIPLTNSLQIHEVKEEDRSLWRIAREYGLSVEVIKRINRKDNEQIVVGEQLIIPLRFGVEPIVLSNCIVNQTVLEHRFIQLVAYEDRDKEIVHHINKKLSSYFGLPEEIYEHPAVTIKGMAYEAFDIETAIQGNILVVNCEAISVDPSKGKELKQWIFDLNTGKLLEEPEIALSSLFSVKGYKQFTEERYVLTVNRLWKSEGIAMQYDYPCMLNPSDLAYDFVGESLYIQLNSCCDQTQGPCLDRDKLFIEFYVEDILPYLSKELQRVWERDNSFSPASMYIIKNRLSK